MSNEICAFCNIGSEPNRIIKTNRLFTSFLSNPRLVTGHSLIVPNRHIESITELSSGEVIDMFSEAQRITAKLLGSTALGVDSWIKTRPDIPESAIKVHHLHMHVIPSNPGDELYSTGTVWTADRFQPLSDSERDNMLTLLNQPTEAQ